MTTSNKGLLLIKEFEGIRLYAYKAVPSEKYYTIGWGHYGPDVEKGMHITTEQADAYLKEDLKAAEKAVNETGREWNQNQFDALVSFTYNCGSGCLFTLLQNRTPAQIADALLLYNKAGGKVLMGLTKRRTAERSLFMAKDTATPSAYAQAAWEAAKRAGITDGSNPLDPATREQVITFLYRAGVIKDA